MCPKGSRLPWMCYALESERGGPHAAPLALAVDKHTRTKSRQTHAAHTKSMWALGTHCRCRATCRLPASGSSARHANRPTNSLYRPSSGCLPAQLQVLLVALIQAAPVAAAQLQGTQQADAWPNRQAISSMHPSPRLHSSHAASTSARRAPGQRPPQTRCCPRVSSRGGTPLQLSGLHCSGAACTQPRKCPGPAGAAPGAAYRVGAHRAYEHRGQMSTGGI